MARFDFGGTSADWVFSTQADGTMRVAAAGLTFWSAKTGGTQYTDLIVDGQPSSAVTVGADGQIPVFQGPDGVTQMWASGGGARALITTWSRNSLTVSDDSLSSVLADEESTARATLNAAFAAKTVRVQQPLGGAADDIQVAEGRRLRIDY